MDSGALGRDYADGDLICRQGDLAETMYVIQAGRVAVIREQDGAEVILAELTSGDIIGELALVDREPRSATVRAIGRARLLTLDRRTFLRAVHEDPSLAFRILQSMAKRIRILDGAVAWWEARYGDSAPAHRSGSFGLPAR